MKNMEMSKNSNGKLNWFLSFVTIIALNANFIPQTNDNTHIFLAILSSFKSNNFINLLLFILLYNWYKAFFLIFHTHFISSEKKYIYLPAALFSIFMVVGISFDLDNSWQLIWGNKFIVIRGLLVFVGYFFLFSSVIAFIFYCFDQYLKNQISVLPPPIPKYLVKNKWLKQYYNQLKKRPFSTTFLTLFIAYIPYIIVSYPGIFMGDTSSQIAQCFNLEEWTSKYLILISENVKLNNHHPVFHSLLIHLFIVIGKVGFNSYNFGIFLYCFFQFIMVLCIIALLMKIYVEQQINSTTIFLTLLYFIFSPRIQNYMFLITKDVLFSVFLLLFILFFQNNRKHNILFLISLVGIILLRNDGKYLLLISVVVTGIFKKNLRKNMLLISSGILCLTTIYSQIILPSFQITPSSRREILSVPFQQTARYIRDAKSDVTIEEKQAISRILSYNQLADKYNPNLADPVKNTFNEFATKSDMKQYFRCWFQMLKKHPGIYLQAIINNKYRFFYPSSILSNPYFYSWSVNSMEITNSLTADEIHTDFAYPPQLNIFRNTYEQFREAIFHLPVLSVLLSSATYTWLLILWTCYCLKCKNITSILYTTPLYVQLLICMAGPCNGEYFRYMYPIAVCLPVVITLGFDALQKKV